MSSLPATVLSAVYKWKASIASGAVESNALPETFTSVEAKSMDNTAKSEPISSPWESVIPPIISSWFNT